MDLCLFDLDPARHGLQELGAVLGSTTAHSVLVTAPRSLTPIAIEAVRRGARGFEPFDDERDAASLLGVLRATIHPESAESVRPTSRRPGAPDGVSSSARRPLHEIRNAIARILGLTELLKGSSSDDISRARRLDEIRSSAASAAELLTDLEDTTSLEDDDDGGSGNGGSTEILLQRADDTSEPGPADGVILLVEDDEALRETYTELLSASGWKVLASPNGFDALLLANIHPRKITLVITDIILPGMSGIEFWRKLSAQQPGMRVLFFTSDIPLARRLLGDDRKTIPILSKFVSAGTLVESVRARMAPNSDPGSDPAG